MIAYYQQFYLCFFFNTKFLLLLLNSFYKKGLEDLWHLLHILNWKVLFLVMFFSFTHVHAVIYVKQSEKPQEAILRENVVLNYLVNYWELLDAQTHHEVP